MEMLKKEISISSRTAASLAIAFVYFILILIMAAHHEPFCDELNVFMAIRNFDFSQMLDYIIKNGNPIPFYALVYPIVKFGFSFKAVQIACVLLSVPAVFLMNRFSPFPFFLNIIITLSAPMMYFFPVIARTYSFLPIVVIAGAAAISFFGSSEHEYKDKLAYCIAYSILILAISWNHAILFGFAFSLFAMFIYDSFYSGKKYGRIEIVSTVFMALALSAIAVQAIIASNQNYLYKYQTVKTDVMGHILPAFFSCFFDPSRSDFFYDFGYLTTPVLTNFLFVLSVVLFVSLIVFLFRVHIKYGLVAIVSVFFPFYVYIFHFSVIYPNRVYITHLVFLFLIWHSMCFEKLSNNVRKTGIVLLTLLFFITIPASFAFMHKDFKDYFSAAENVAEYIFRYVPNDGKNICVATIHWQGLSVAYHLKDRHVYMLDSNDIKRIENYMPENNLLSSGILAGREWIYVVASKYQAENLAALGYEFVYATPKAMLPEEDYVIFRKRLNTQ